MNDNLIPLDLAAEIRSGDETRRNRAFRTIYDNPKVRFTVKRIVRDMGLTRLEPEDILQDAILELDRKICDGTFQGKSTVTTFLLGICRFMVSDHVRNRTERRVAFRGVIGDADCESPEVVAALLAADETEGMVLSERLQAEEDLAAENARLAATLREKCQEALKLKYLEGLRMADIFEKVELKNERQAIRLLYDCRNKLRELCRESPVVQRLMNYLGLRFKN